MFEEKIIVTSTEVIQKIISDIFDKKLESILPIISIEPESYAKTESLLLRRDELKAMLKCSYPKIRRLMQRGLPYKRLDRILYFDKNEVLDFLSAS